MDKKKAPFTDPEKQLVSRLLAKYDYIINCRETDSVNTRKKAATWQKITDEFNASYLTSAPATVKQLKKLWNNSKSKARKAIILGTQRRMTDGGPPILNVIPEHELALPIIKSEDCDEYVDSEADANDDAWRSEKKHPVEIFDKATTPVTTHIEDITTEAASHITDNDTSRQVITRTPVPQSFSRKFVKRGKRIGREMDSVRKQIMEDDLEHRIVMNKNAREYDKIIKELQIKREEMLLEEQKYKTELAKWMYSNREKVFKFSSVPSHIF